MLAASPSSSASPMCRRGWRGFGRMRARGISVGPGSALRCGISAARPRPSPLWRSEWTVMLLLPGRVDGRAGFGSCRLGPRDEFRGECGVGLGAARVGSVERDRQAVAGRLGEPDAARDDGVVDGTPEVPADLVGDFRRELRSGVVHRQHDAVDLETGIQVSRTRFTVADQLGEPFEGVVLALDRDQHRVRGGQRVDGQQPERRRPVDEDRSRRSRRPRRAPSPGGDPAVRVRRARPPLRPVRSRTERTRARRSRSG